MLSVHLDYSCVTCTCTLSCMKTAIYRQIVSFLTINIIIKFFVKYFCETKKKKKHVVATVVTIAVSHKSPWCHKITILMSHNDPKVLKLFSWRFCVRTKHRGNAKNKRDIYKLKYNCTIILMSTPLSVLCCVY